MVVNLDLLTFAGDLQNLKEIFNSANYTSVKGDICDRILVQSLFKKYNSSEVIHFAAESHIDNSIKNPDVFLRTNVFGTFNLLDAAKNYWMESPHIFKKNFKNLRFYRISIGDVGLFTEKIAFAPNSYYSASKS
jgi:dTDP-glucose 4,6-dehydratase